MVLKRSKDVIQDGCTLQFRYNSEIISWALDQLWRILSNSYENESYQYDVELYYRLLTQLDDYHSLLNVSDENLTYSVSKQGRWGILEKIRDIVDDLSSPSLKTCGASQVRVCLVEHSVRPHCHDAVLQCGGHASRSPDGAGRKRCYQSFPSHTHYRGTQRVENTPRIVAAGRNHYKEEHVEDDDGYMGSSADTNHLSLLTTAFSHPPSEISYRIRCSPTVQYNVTNTFSSLRRLGVEKERKKRRPVNKRQWVKDELRSLTGCSASDYVQHIFAVDLDDEQQPQRASLTSKQNTRHFSIKCSIPETKKDGLLKDRSKKYVKSFKVTAQVKDIQMSKKIPKTKPTVSQTVGKQCVASKVLPKQLQTESSQYPQRVSLWRFLKVLMESITTNNMDDKTTKQESHILFKNCKTEVFCSIVRDIAANNNSELNKSNLTVVDSKKSAGTIGAKTDVVLSSDSKTVVKRGINGRTRKKLKRRKELLLNGSKTKEEKFEDGCLNSDELLRTSIKLKSSTVQSSYLIDKFGPAYYEGSCYCVPRVFSINLSSRVQDLGQTKALSYRGQSTAEIEEHLFRSDYRLVLLLKEDRIDRDPASVSRNESSRGNVPNVSADFIRFKLIIKSTSDIKLKIGQSQTRTAVNGRRGLIAEFVNHLIYPMGVVVEKIIAWLSGFIDIIQSELNADSTSSHPTQPQNTDVGPSLNRKLCDMIVSDHNYEIYTTRAAFNLLKKRTYHLGPCSSSAFPSSPNINPGSTSVYDPSVTSFQPCACCLCSAIVLQPAQTLTTIQPCAHSVCINCLRLAAQHKLRYGLPLDKCPVDSCESRIELVTWLEAVSLNSYWRHVLNTFQWSLLEHPSWTLCPNRKCGHVVKRIGELEERVENHSLSSATVFCDCGESFCFYCSTSSHYPATCQEAFSYRQCIQTEGLDVIRPTYTTVLLSTTQTISIRPPTPPLPSPPSTPPHIPTPRQTASHTLAPIKQRLITLPPIGGKIEGLNPATNRKPPAPRARVRPLGFRPAIIRRDDVVGTSLDVSSEVKGQARKSSLVPLRGVHGGMMSGGVELGGGSGGGVKQERVGGVGVKNGMINGRLVSTTMVEFEVCLRCLDLKNSLIKLLSPEYRDQRHQKCDSSIWFHLAPVLFYRCALNHRSSFARARLPGNASIEMKAKSLLLRYIKGSTFDSQQHRILQPNRVLNGKNKTVTGGARDMLATKSEVKDCIHPGSLPRLQQPVDNASISSTDLFLLVHAQKFTQQVHQYLESIYVLLFNAHIPPSFSPSSRSSPQRAEAKPPGQSEGVVDPPWQGKGVQGTLVQSILRSIFELEQIVEDLDKLFNTEIEEKLTVTPVQLHLRVERGTACLTSLLKQLETGSHGLLCA